MTNFIKGYKSAEGMDFNSLITNLMQGMVSAGVLICQNMQAPGAVSVCLSFSKMSATTNGTCCKSQPL